MNLAKLLDREKLFNDEEGQLQMVNKGGNDIFRSSQSERHASN